MFKLLAAVSIVQLGTCHIFNSQYQRTNEPLILTPFIEADRIHEAQHLSRVKFTESIGLKSYSGFFTVNKKYGSNQFFWYFPPLSNNEKVPIVLWLQGGPGVSSLYGLFEENGPIEIKNNKIQKRAVNWASDHHLLYIDNPVGVGFSFTNSSDGYAKNEEQIGHELYQSILQFFQLFPHLQKNSFFVTGESYAGKYVPALCKTIDKMNKEVNAGINIVGFAIGNGWTDPVHQVDHENFLYQIGLIDNSTVEQVKILKWQLMKYLDEGNWLNANDLWSQIKFTMLDNVGEIDGYNFLQDKNVSILSDNEYPFVVVLNQNRDSLHVGTVQFDFFNENVFSSLREDVMQSVAPLISELLSQYRGLIYSGQLDTVVPYPTTLNYLQHLSFSSADEYRGASRHIWRVDGEVAGYAKVAGNLTEVLVRNAGHMVPLDQPKNALDLITKFVRNQSLHQGDYQEII